MNHYYNCEKLTALCEKLRAGEPVTIVALGDSNTCNHIFTAGAKQWPELFATELQTQCDSQQVTLINRGICGDTAQQGLSRLQRDVLRFDPDLVIVTFGTNDANKEVVDTYLPSLRSIVRQCTDRGSVVLLKTITPILESQPTPAHLWLNDTRHQEVVEQTVAYARQEGVPCIDIYNLWRDKEREGTLGMARLMFDEVHTNSAGHRLVARMLLPAFSLQPLFHSERD
jgi:lysophospholipase L1-like esterase